MSGTRTRPLRLKLTVRQMMKLVAFSAIVSFCLVQGIRFEQELAAPSGSKRPVASWVFVLAVEGVAIPLVLAIVALPLVRKGPLKDWVIRILLLVPVSATLLVLLVVFVVSAIARRGPLARDDPGMLVLGGSIIVFGWAFAHFLRRAVPGRCPECRLPTLLSTLAITRRLTKERVYQCLTCEGRFRKLDGAWTPASLELDPGPGSS